jgi:hypothetical protein
MRIKSDHGHLSNKYAGETLAELLGSRRTMTSDVACGPSGPGNGPAGGAAGSLKPLEIMLAHLSFHNNAPYYARNTIVPILEENGFERDVDYTLTIAAKDEITTF